MKKILPYLILLIITIAPCSLFAQLTVPFNFITFDVGDSIWHHIIYIDTVHCEHNIWQVGKPHKTVFDSAFSYPNAIVTDTLNPYSPNDTSVFIMTFPGKVASWWFQELSFAYKLNIDSTSTAIIEYSADSGKTWINLADSTPNGFDMLQPLVRTSGWHYLGISTFRGPDGPYYQNDSMQLKFMFISGNDSVGKDGWMIDNYQLIYGMEGVTGLANNGLITLNPNPATNQIMISAPANITTLSITNLLGQAVYTNRYSSKEVEVDVSTLPSGVYLIRINGTEVRRFVKQ